MNCPRRRLVSLVPGMYMLICTKARYLLSLCVLTLQYHEMLTRRCLCSYGQHWLSGLALRLHLLKKSLWQASCPSMRRLGNRSGRSMLLKTSHMTRYAPQTLGVSLSCSNYLCAHLICPDKLFRLYFCMQLAQAEFAEMLVNIPQGEEPGPACSLLQTHCLDIFDVCHY